MSTNNVSIIKADHNAPYIRVDLNIEYECYENNKLNIHIIRPSADESARFPLIVFSQGSSWFKQDMGKEIIQLSSFAKRGFVIGLAEYRSVNECGFPAQIIDTNSATRFLISNADKYNIDSNNVFLWGTSSGGHTVLMCGLTKELQEFSKEDILQQPINYKAIIDYYGPTDITKLVSEEEAYKYAGIDSPLPLLINNDNIWHAPEITDKLIPMKYIDDKKKCPPILIVHGLADSMVNHQQSIDLYDDMIKKGQNAKLILLENADHGGGCFWTDDLLSEIETFIRGVIIKP